MDTSCSPAGWEGQAGDAASQRCSCPGQDLLLAVMLMNTASWRLNCPQRPTRHACAAAAAEEGEEGELPVDTAAAQGKAATSEEAAGAAEAPKLSFKLRARMEAFLFEVQVSFISF